MSVLSRGGGHPGASGPSLNGAALGLPSAVAIGLAAPAPAFALAATIGLVVATAGVHTPAVLLLAAVPMVLIAVAFAELNRVQPDCGAVFTWSRRTLGRPVGFLAGWSVLAASTVVLGVLVKTAALYTFLLLDWEAAARSTFAVTALGTLLIVAVTAFSVLGVELSGRAALILVIGQTLALVLLAVVALVDVLAGGGEVGAVTPAVSWFSPFAAGSTDAVIDSLLVAVFLYWGWDCAVFLTEETADGAHVSGRAALLSVGLLLGVYLLVGTGLLAHAGPVALGAATDDALDTAATSVLGSPLDKLVVLAVLTASAASAQVTVVAQARTMLAMARVGDLPPALARIHPRLRTPPLATLVSGAAGAAWYVTFTAVSDQVLADSLLATGIFVVFYHGLAGVACAVHFRRRLVGSPRAFLTLGLLPLTGAAIFAYVLGRTILDFTRDPGQGGAVWLGVQPPLVIAAGLTLVGVAWMLASAASAAGAAAPAAPGVPAEEPA
jgi:amino acid transporter